MQATSSSSTSQPQPMDIDPIDDGPRPALAGPVTATVQPMMMTTTIAGSTNNSIMQEEEARQAIDLLRGEDLSGRVSAAHRLDAIAKVLGPERTREELLPFVTDGVDDEDEVLLAMASSLGRMVEHVGGPEFAHNLLSPLELLLAVEETIVRETASTSVQAIAEQLPPETFQQDYTDMIRRLATKEWFTARMSSAGLIAASYPKLVYPHQRDEHVSLFARLCQDDTPMVRRVAAQYLGVMLQNVVEANGRAALQEDGVVVQVLLPLYKEFASSEQPDSVRLQTAENCVAFGQVMSGWAQNGPLQDFEVSLLQEVLPLIVATIDDRSWRVRWTAAAKFADVITSYDALPDAMDLLIPAYEKLLRDPEAEVRTAATLNLAQVAKCQARVPIPPPTSPNSNSSNNNNDTIMGTTAAEEDPNGPRISVAERLVTRLTTLTEDDSEHVRAALAMVATELAPALGRDATIMYLVPPVLLLLRDATSEVRLNLISSLSALNEVIGVDLLSQSLLPAILDLAQDGKWRIRLAIIENIPLLAKQLGRDFFTEKLTSLCVGWLGDDIASIRKAAAMNLKELTALFGAEWAIEHLVPAVDEILVHESYLRRLTALQACSMMATVMDPDTARLKLLPKILEMALDSVANIRFNVAKELQTLAPHCAAAYETQILPVLTTLMDDDDRDVRYFAERAIAALDENFAYTTSDS